SQAPFMAINYLASQDPRIAKAEKWVRDNIARDFAIEELAKAVALAPRTFARRVSATCGISPIQFVQRIRLETARLLLETTRLSVDELARRVGYAEPSTLRRLIRRDTKHPPGHFRPAALASPSLAISPASIAEYRLHLEIFFKSKKAELPAVAGLLVATERQAAVERC